MQHWIQLHVAWIITCQFQLHLGVSWAPDQRIIMIPGVGTYQTLVRNPMRVLPLDGVQCESSSYSLFVGRVSAFQRTARLAPNTRQRILRCSAFPFWLITAMTDR